MVAPVLKGIKNNLKSKITNFKAFKSVGLNFFRIKYLKHATSKKIKRYKLLKNNISYVNGPDFLHSLLEIFVGEIYKIDIPQDAVIIDCGANIGLSVIYLNNLYPNARIIAYEPDEINFELLTYNINCIKKDKIELNQAAVWISEGYIDFENTGGLGSKIVSGEKSEKSKKIKSIRLRDRLTNKIHLLKMDIEGAEYEVIKDIKDKLHFVDNIFIEYHGKFDNQSEYLEIINILLQSGFAFYIKEAANIYPTPFLRGLHSHPYDVQLNIFCFRNV